MRNGIDMRSKEIGKIAQKKVVKSTEQLGNRILITEPMEGWISFRNSKGYYIVQEVLIFHIII